jgi:hypothetical protein
LFNAGVDGWDGRVVGPRPLDAMDFDWWWSFLSVGGVIPTRNGCLVFVLFFSRQLDSPMLNITVGRRVFVRSCFHPSHPSIILVVRFDFVGGSSQKRESKMIGLNLISYVGCRLFHTGLSFVTQLRPCFLVESY